jgi:phosphate transport system substrate-binding protein
VTTSTFRRAIVPSVAALALAGGLAACGSSNDSGNSSSDMSSTSTSMSSTSSMSSSMSSSDSTAPAVNNSGTLTGGGSTAQGSAQVQWATDFQKQNSGTTINYNQVGSGAGRTSFESGAYTFAGSDAFIDDPTEYKAAVKQCGTDPIEVPDYVSPVAIVFHLSGVTSLKLDPQTIAKMFDGTIKTWNDPAITKQNPGVNLPSTNIQPVHRSDDSGTTQNFTEYLSEAGGKSAWPHEPSQTWPTTSGLNGDGTSGVVTTAQGTDGSLAYVDASKAGGFGVVSVKVGSQYVAPSAAGAANDLAISKTDKSAKSDQMIYDVARTSSDPKNYPVLLVSYLIACPTYKSSSVATLVKNYLSYVVSAAGQKSGSTAAASAPLPAALSAKATQIISKIH